jgi:hypothetical protein
MQFHAVVDSHGVKDIQQLLTMYKLPGWEVSKRRSNGGIVRACLRAAWLWAYCIATSQALSIAYICELGFSNTCSDSSNTCSDSSNTCSDSSNTCSNTLPCSWEAFLYWGGGGGGGADYS